MNSPRNLSDRDLKIAIANAKWSLEYDMRQMDETADMEKNRGFLDRVLGNPAVDSQVKLQEQRSFVESGKHLISLVEEAERRGIDAESIPVRSKKDYYGDFA